MFFLTSAFITAAQPTVYYTDPSGNNIISFDWDGNGDLFYQTATSSYGFGGFYKYDIFLGILDTLQPPFDFMLNSPGASVLTIGEFVYFNASGMVLGQNIFKYNGITTLDLVSATPNYGLYTNGTDMFISGAGLSGINHILYVPVGATGTLGTVVDLGKTNGAPGPMIFDGAKNLYYADQYGDTAIYKWSAAEVAAAIADPVNHPLMADRTHLWYNYSTVYQNAAGATSMAISSTGDQLLVTLTNFSGPSLLVEFGISGGTYDNTTSVIYSSNSRLGEVRVRSGITYLAVDDQILEVQ
jgi:hypothetical protein